MVELTDELLVHLYHVDFLNDNGLKELIKRLRMETLEQKSKIQDMEFKLRAVEKKK